MQFEKFNSIISRLVVKGKLLNNELSPILGGRNNRAYHVVIDGHDYFVKHYNTSQELTRSRLNAEYTFLSYAASCGNRYVPKPIAYDEGLSLGVYEYIRGNKYKDGEIGFAEIKDAAQFVIDLNQQRSSSKAAQLLPAAEACFSIAEHVNQIDRRVKRLSTIIIGDRLDEEAIGFIKQELLPAWELLREKTLTRLEKANISLTNTLLLPDKIISPSDFGFHNALKQMDGKIKFVDFEYSGWDDPAKLVGDFFGQIEVPVSLDYFEYFTGQIADLVTEKDLFMDRAQFLLYLYRIKWACIVLNYFLPAAKLQKCFVAQVTDLDRQTQLNKAKHIVAGLQKISL